MTVGKTQRVKAFLIIKEFLELKLFVIFVRRIPISKIPLFRELLEENGFRLTDRQRMTDMVPLILSQEKEKTKNEIAGKCLSVIFDGAIRLGEIFVCYSFC